MNNTTLLDFVLSCPQGVRLGQWFVICYWKGSPTEKSIHLFSLDKIPAFFYIVDLLEDWQWDTQDMPSPQINL